MDIKKICFLVNYNMYESKRYFTEKFAQALNKKNIETMILDTRENSLSAETIRQVVLFDPDLSASFNTLLPNADGRFLWDILQIPHWSILLDPAIYSLNLTQSPFSLLSTVDRDDEVFLRQSGFKRSFFFPHAVESELIGSGHSTKDLDVVFLGSCYDYESLRVSWRQQNPEPINNVLDNAIDLVFGDNSTSLAAALAKAWNDAQLPPDGVDFSSLFYYLDNYTRGKDRVELIRSIKDVPVHVYGALSEDNAVGMLGWAPYLASCSNVTVHPPVAFSEGLEILKRTKIALNSMPFFKNGSHERVLTALACGALPVTTDTRFFREYFDDGKNIIFYQPKDRHLVNERVCRYVHNDSECQKLVEKGKAVIAKNFTWDNRVEDLAKSNSFI